MGITGFVIIYSTVAATLIAGHLVIVGIISSGQTVKNNKSFTIILALLIAVSALLSISYDPASTLFWVMAPGALALAHVALCIAATGLFVEQRDSHESYVAAGTDDVDASERSHQCVAVSAVRCPAI